MMRHALPFGVTEIPEWKFFYYNYSLLTEIVEILQDLALIRDHLRVMVMSNSPLGSQHLLIYSRQRMFVEVIDYMHEANSIFFRYRNQEMELTYIFAQMKSQQLERKASFYMQITEECEKGMDDCLILLENTYIENEFLHRLVQYSLEKEQSIMNMHKTISKRYEDFDTPFIDDKKITRISDRIKDVNKNMKDQYSLKWMGQNKQATEEQKNFLAKNQLKGIVRNEHAEDFPVVVGDFLLKFCLGFMGFALLLLIYLIIHYDIRIEQDETFKDLFPLWRGLSYFIVYNWVLAFNALIFQNHHINYRKILNLERNKIPKPEFMFFSATIFSIIYLILFIMFVLKFREFSDFGGFRLDMFPAVGWMVFIGLICYPFGSSYYFVIILFYMFISPLIGVNYTSNWLSEQLSSFKIPFHDVSYTILYYFGNQTELDKSWEDARYIGAWIGTYIYLLRITQGMRKGCALGRYFVGVPLFKGCLKCIFNIITIWTAYLYRANGEDSSFLIYWIIAGTVSTSYAYTYDIVYDWNLIQNCCCYGKVMRQKKILGGGDPKVYILMMLVNLVLRVAWLFTISTDFVISAFSYPQVFVLVVAILEIIRRGIWNLGFIEKQHVAHCENFDCMVNDSSIESNVIRVYQKNSETSSVKEEKEKKIKSYKNDQKAKESLQLETIKRMLKKKEESEKQIYEFIQKSRNYIVTTRQELGIQFKS